MKLEFSTQILEETQISNFIEIRPVRPELFHAYRRMGGRMDRHADRHDAANCRF